jgi:hypothetical protein
MDIGNNIVIQDEVFRLAVDYNFDGTWFFPVDAKGGEFPLGRLERRVR